MSRFSRVVQQADLRMASIGVAAWGGTLWGTSARFEVVGFGLALSFCVLAWRRGWRLGIAVALVGGLAVALGSVRAHSIQASRLGELAAAGAICQIVAEVSGEPRYYPARGALPARTLVPVRVVQLESRGTRTTERTPAQLVIAESEVPEVGASLQVRVRTAPGDADLAAYLTPYGDLEVSPPGWFYRLINQLRSGLHEAMRRSLPEQAGLVPALVVGDTSGLPTEVEDDFKATGLTHLTAVSGTNLTLMLVFLLGAARAIGIRGWWLRGVAVAGVVGFVLLCRVEPSVLRAGVMGSIALGATGVSTDYRKGLRNLGVAVSAIVLLDPWLARSWGFALSVAATSGILCLAPRWRTRLEGWLPTGLADALCVPLAAQTATFPLVVALAGQLSVIGVFANLAVGWFVGPVTVLGLLACLTAAVFPGLGTGFGWCAGWAAEPILQVAHRGAELPGATLTVGNSAWTVVVVVLLCLVAVPAFSRAFDRPLGTLGLGVLLTVWVVHPLQPLGWPGTWQVVFCDVGQGDAAVANLGAGVGLLIDGGPDPGALHDCLDSVGVSELALVVVSHQHADHVDGLNQLTERYQVGAVQLRAGLDESVIQEFLVFLGDPDLPVRDAGAEPQLRVGPTTWTTLHSGIATGTTVGPDDAAENNAGTIGVLEIAGLRVLFTGDAEPDAQRASWRAGLAPVDVLKVPHHGSANQFEGLLAGAGARVAVISVGTDNSYGHPAEQTIQQLQRSGARVWRTDHAGAIAVSKVDGALQVRTHG